MRLKSDLVELVDAALAGSLPAAAAWDERACLGVVMAADGYPGAYEKGARLTGLEDDEVGTKVFHAGTAMQDGHVVASGGRVLCVCALGATVAKAQQRAYRRLERIGFPGAHFRRDIGYRAIARGA